MRGTGVVHAANLSAINNVVGRHPSHGAGDRLWQGRKFSNLIRGRGKRQDLLPLGRWVMRRSLESNPEPQ